MITDYKKISNLDKIKTGDHTVLLYKNESEIISASISFIKSSLERNEKCLYIKGDAKTEILMAELRENIPELNQYLEEKQLQILSKEETYALSKKFEADKMITLLKKESLKALEEGYNGLAITGELSWVLNFKNGKKEIIEYEWKLNEYLFDSFPVVAMCRYNLEKFDSRVVKSIIELHHYIIWQGKIHENPYYIQPEGYRDNKIEEYEIESWLENIQEYEKRESKFKEKLKSKDKKYEFLFNKINDAVYLHEVDENDEFSNFLKVNNKACEMLGYSRKELLNMSPKDLDSPKFREKNRHKLSDKIKYENEMTLETEHITSSGEIIPIELSINYYQSHGNKYLLTIARDISERKNKENELISAKNDLQIKNESLEANNEEIKAMNNALDIYINEINELNMRFIKLIDLFSNKKNFNYENENIFLNDMLETAIKIIPEADYGSIYKYSNGKVNFVGVKGYKLEDLRKLYIPAKAFYNINDDIEVITHEEIEERNNRLMGSKNHSKLNDMHKIKEMLRMDLKMFGDKKLGLNLDIDQESSQVFDDNSMKIFKAFHNIASSFYKLKEYNNLQNSFTKELVTSIIKLLEMHDLYTKGHSENVAKIASKIAKSMELSDKVIDNTYWAGLVHDIGKLLIPLDILNKKDKLTDEEFELIKGHPVFGSRALKGSDSLKHIARYVKFHHERWDGTGYPYGIAHDEIPLVSQILQLADSWDAMRSDRAYRKGLTIDEAVEEIKINKGKQFSPKIVNVFLRMLDNQSLNLK